MPQEVVPACTGKCEMVNMYKAINRGLTRQNSEYREALAQKDRELKELRQLALDQRTEIAEYKKSGPNTGNTEVVALGSELFASITNSVQKAKEKWATMQNSTMQSGGASLLNTNTSLTPVRTSLQSKTPTNVSRIRPIIRTPNGLMQSVSISLPRIDQSMMFPSAERFANSTTISEDQGSSSSSNGETFQSEEHPESSVIEPTLDMIPDTTRDAEPSNRLPRHTSEMPVLEPETFDSATRPNPELIQDAPGDLSYYDGLSIIHEVTEVEYTPTIENEEESSGGEEIVSHQISKASLRSNKENTLKHTQNTSISQATCSTPYSTTNHPERLSNMKIAKVVLQQLNMDEVASHDTDSSEPSSQSGMVSTRKRATRKRKESERSVEDSDDESRRSSTRPKRRATPTSFKEPALNSKMRRPT